MAELLIDLLIVCAILSIGVTYGTDVFFAVVGRTALQRASDASLAEVMGRIHEGGDSRMPVFGPIGLVSTLAFVIATGLGSASGWLGILALGSLLGHLAFYLRVSKPVNHQLTAAARLGHTPANPALSSGVGTASSGYGQRS